MKIKIVLYSLMTFIIVFFCTCSILTVDAVIENISVNNQLNDFLSKGVYIEELNGIHYYQVDIEEELTSPSIEIINNRPYSTTKGDIFVNRESVLNMFPFVAEFITFYFGGHAGIVVDRTKVIETTGMESNPEDNVVIKGYNNIFSSSLKRSAIGLRVKANEEEINKAMTYAESKVGALYNYSFVLNRKNTFYCTDIVARSFGKEAGLDFNLDKDGIAVSCNDLINSEDTFITYYSFYIDNEMHLYYAV